MKSEPPVSEPDSSDAHDDGFAMTVAEELLDEESSPGDERALESLPTIGHVGRYALKHQLGVGGLGTVFAAIDPLLSRPIAVKTLRIADIAADQRTAFGERLLAEARAAAGLSHPHIVTVFDAGLADEGVYIAMERLRGRDLRHLLADGWRPDAVQAARIAKRVADALAYAHGHGVVHCDIKPANVFMIGRTQPKVLDFGIARVTQEGSFESTFDPTSGASVPPPDLGSPYYAAPEHLRGEPLDARCDVYGVGVVLYEMLTGRRPFDGRTLEAIRGDVLGGEVVPVHVLNEGIDPTLSNIVARAMARDPAARYRSARHLSRALRDWISDETNGTGHARSSSRVNRAWMWAGGATVGVATAAVLALFALPTLTSRVSDQALAGPPTMPAAVPAPVSAPVPEAAASEPAIAAAVESSAPSVPSTPGVAALPETAAVIPPAPDTAPVSSSAAVTAASTAPKGRDDASRPREPQRARTANSSTPAKPSAAAPLALGVVQLAVVPWGSVEVNGRSAGLTPPLDKLNLTVGTHQIVIRNADFAPLITTVTVTEDKPVVLRHRFGS